MAIIDQLPTLPTEPTTGDEIPIERGTTVYKVDYDDLATTAVEDVLGDPVTIAHGGTGATTVAAAQEALGLVVATLSEAKSYLGIS